jgi:hypothetical protein
LYSPPPPLPPPPDPFIIIIIIGIDLEDPGIVLIRAAALRLPLFACILGSIYCMRCGVFRTNMMKKKERKKETSDSSDESRSEL